MLKDGWFICVAEDEWQHHFREDNYKPLNDLTVEEMNRLPFIKLAKKSHSESGTMHFNG